MVATPPATCAVSVSTLLELSVPVTGDAVVTYCEQLLKGGLICGLSDPVTVPLENWSGPLKPTIG